MSQAAGQGMYCAPSLSSMSSITKAMLVAMEMPANISAHRRTMQSLTRSCR